MKKVLIFATVILTISCKKNKVDTLNNVATEQVLEKRVSQIITPTSNFTETIDFSKVGDTLVEKYTYSNTNSVYTYKRLNTGGITTVWSYTNNAPNTTTTYWLNSMGYVDTAASIRPNNTINSTGKYTYYSDGLPKTQKTDYQSYYNLVTFYNDGEKNTYRIYDFVRISPTASATKDSTVYNYQTEWTNSISHLSPLERMFGKHNKYLIKSALTYSLPSLALTREDTYTYAFNAQGNVTQRTVVIKNLTTNVEDRRETTTYTYKL